MKKQCMVILVENNAGVLARVSSLFMQRGFNIDSLTVSSTENPKISRITVMTTGDQKKFSQILKQTTKLVETKMIFSVEPTFSLIHDNSLVSVINGTISPNWNYSTCLILNIASLNEFFVRTELNIQKSITESSQLKETVNKS